MPRCCVLLVWPVCMGLPTRSLLLYKVFLKQMLIQQHCAGFCLCKNQRKNLSVKRKSPPKNSKTFFFFFFFAISSVRQFKHRLKLKMEICKLRWKVDIQLWPYWLPKCCCIWVWRETILQEVWINGEARPYTYTFK